MNAIVAPAGTTAAKPATKTFGRLRHDGEDWELTTDQTHVVIRLKRVFPRLSAYGAHRFTFQGDEAHACDLAWFLERYPMEMSDADRLLLHEGHDRHMATGAQMEAIIQGEWTPPTVTGLAPGQSARDHQLQAVAIARLRGGLLVGDPVGAGKTYTAILLALSGGGDLLPMAVVVEPHLQSQWAEKIGSFSTLRAHEVKVTKPYEMPPADIVVFRYSNVHGWTSVFKQGFFRSCAFDEVQALRNGTKTDKGGACKILADSVDVRIGLSATPIFNRRLEIHPVLDFVKGRDGHHPLGTIHEFEREWTDGEAVRDPRALGSHLRDCGAFLRRSKGELGQPDDPVVPIPVSVPYDASEERRIEDLARTLAIKTLRGSFVERGSAARDLDLLMRQATGVAKARGVAQFVRMIAEEGRTVLVAVWHRAVYPILMRELEEFSPVMYSGSESPVQKRKAIEAIMEGRSKILLMSLRSGAGVDGLQHVCSDAVIAEFDWAPPVHHQFFGRIDREGQKEPVNAFYCHADTGSDPDMVEMLGIKSSDIVSVVDPDIDLSSLPMHDEGRIKTLARRWLARRGVHLEDAADDAAEADAAEPCEDSKGTSGHAVVDEPPRCATRACAEAVAETI